MQTTSLTAQHILVAAHRIPAVGRAYRALSTALHDPDASLYTAIEIVRLDGALAARILRSANSVVFRRGDPSRSLDDAIGRVGLREVARLAGAIVAERMCSDGLPHYRTRGDLLWSNTLASALAAEHIAGCAGTDQKQAYTLGIVRQVGRLLVQRIVLDLALPPIPASPFDAAATQAWEMTHLGATAEELGGRMLRMWEFPDEQASVLIHVAAPEKHPEQSRECAGLHLACWAAEILGKGLPAESGAWRLDGAVLEQAGLSEAEARDTLIATRASLNRTISAMQG